MISEPRMTLGSAHSMPCRARSSAASGVKPKPSRMSPAETSSADSANARQKRNDDNLEDTR